MILSLSNSAFVFINLLGEIQNIYLNNRSAPNQIILFSEHFSAGENKHFCAAVQQKKERDNHICLLSDGSKLVECEIRVKFPSFDVITPSFSGKLKYLYIICRFTCFPSGKT